MIDIHPLLIHFPIALLSVYTVTQLIPPRWLWRNTTLFTLNTFLLLVGSATLLIARQSGDLLEHSRQFTPLMHTHSQWATMTTVLYGILTIFYFLLLALKLTEVGKTPWLRPYTKILQPAQWLFNNYIITLVALVGAGLLLVTGALGGGIVYGPTADPLVQFVTTWLVK